MTVLGVVLALPVLWLLLTTACLIAVGRAWSAALSGVEPP